MNEAEQRSSGVGLVELMIAVAILVIIALAISQFTISQVRQSRTIEGSSACNNVVQTVVDQFKSIGVRLDVAPPFVPDSSTTSRQVTPTNLPNFIPAWSNPVLIDTNAPPTVRLSHLIVGNTSAVESLLNQNLAAGICNPAIETGDITVEANRGMRMNSLLPANHSLQNANLWINILPVNLQTSDVEPCPISPIYSRPPSSAFTGNSVGGNPAMGTLGSRTDLGYRMHITVSHTEPSQGGQAKLCRGQASFSHQLDEDAAGTIVINTPTADGTALDTDGGVYTACNRRNIEFDIDITDLELGSTLICQTRVIEGGAVEPITKSWVACDQTRFTGQTGATTTSWNGSRLTMQFSTLATDRGYELNVASVDTAGNVNTSASGPVQFFVDYTRPTVNIFHDNKIGPPEDGRQSRGVIPGAYKSYGAPNWNAVLPNDQVQCNSNSVTFTHTITDPLQSNLVSCTSTGLTTPTCNGVTGPLTHSMRTVTMTARDACDPPAGSSSFTWPVILSFGPITPPATSTFDRDSTKSALDTDYFPITVTSPVPVINSPRNFFVVACDCNPLTVDGTNSRTCYTQRGGITDSCRAPVAGNNFEYVVFDICGRPGAAPPTSATSYEVQGDVFDSCSAISCGTTGNGVGADRLVCYKNNAAPPPFNPPWVETCRQAPVGPNPTCTGGGYPPGVDPGLYDCSACGAAPLTCTPWPWAGAGITPECGLRKFGVCAPGGLPPPPPPGACIAPNFPDLGACTSTIPGSTNQYCDLVGSCYQVKTCPAGGFNSFENCEAARTDPWKCIPDPADLNCHKLAKCDPVNEDFIDIELCEAQAGFVPTRDACNFVDNGSGLKCYKWNVRCPRRGDPSSRGGNPIPAVQQEGGTWLKDPQDAYATCTSYIRDRFNNEGTGANGYHRRICSRTPGTLFTDTKSNLPLCFSYFTKCPSGPNCNAITDDWWWSIAENRQGGDAIGCNNRPCAPNRTCVVVAADNYVTCDPDLPSGDPPPPPPPGAPAHECPVAGACVSSQVCCGGRANQYTICKANCVTNASGIRVIVSTGLVCNTGPAACGPLTACFVGETLILMADGTEKPISMIRRGDLVISFDETTSSQVIKPVLNVIEHPPESRVLYKIHLSNGATLTGTQEHRVRAARRPTEFADWITIGDLQDGYTMYFPVSMEKSEAVQISNIEKVESFEPVYNFHVQDTRTYIANGLVVHNLKPLE